MATKLTEIKKLVEVLEQDYDNVQDAAKAAFKAVEEMIWEREQYVVVVQHWDKIMGKTALVQAFGPFANRERAAKEAEKRVMLPTATVDTQWRVALLKHYEMYNM